MPEFDKERGVLTGPEWVKPEIGEEKDEIKRTSVELGLDLLSLIDAVRNGQMMLLKADDWSRLENTESHEPVTIDQAKKIIEDQKAGRDIDRIIAGFDRKDRISAPIILFRDDYPPYLISGNTRLLVARAKGARPMVLAARLESPDKIVETVELTRKKYNQLLTTYNSVFQRIKDLERSGRSSFDETIRFKIDDLEHARHEIHGQLLKIGAHQGKKSADVMVDIIREKGTLQEYGLPEFAVLQEGDIMKVGRRTGLKSFNFNAYNGVPGNRERAQENISVVEKEKTVADKPKSDDYVVENVIPHGHVMIVYDISPIERYGESDDEEKLCYPIDYKVRKARAKALSAQVGGSIFEDDDGMSYHEVQNHLLGVIIPNEKLEEVTTIIRNSPGKYRVGDQFYSDEDKVEIEKAKKDKVEELRRVKEYDSESD